MGGIGLIIVVEGVGWIGRGDRGGGMCLGWGKGGW